MGRKKIKPNCAEIFLPDLGVVKLYPISVLCAELKKAGCERNDYTIREDWIKKKKLLPPPLFKKKRNRMWSADQIGAIVAVVKHLPPKKGLVDAEYWDKFKRLMWGTLGKVNQKYIVAMERKNAQS